jgi:nicotinate-nucleotide adenylyltransferase
MNKIGIYSGTFDPVHMGHVAFALEAKQALGLDEVVFLPEASPRDKEPAALEHRTKMLELSLQGQPGLSVKMLTDARFSIPATLPTLERQFPDARLVFLIGSDIVHTFKYRWPGLDQLFRKTSLAIGLRGKDSEGDVNLLMQACAREFGMTPDYRVLPSPRAQLASTHVRLGAHTIDDIHPDVAAYIRQHKLYG